MRPLSLVAVASLSTAALAADRPTFSVANVVAAHEALNGKVVRVHGWLNRPCYRLGCAIQASTDQDSAAVSIGGSSSFDLALTSSKAVGREIIVEGRVNRACFDHAEDGGAGPRGDIVVCTDRADELIDPKLIDVLATSAQ